MPVIVTVMARVTDWQTLQELNNDVIRAKAQAIKATRYHVYRNANDASLALLLVELPDPDDVCEMRATLIEQLSRVAKINLADDRVWEPTNWETVAISPKERDM